MPNRPRTTRLTVLFALWALVLGITTAAGQHAAQPGATQDGDHDEAEHHDEHEHEHSALEGARLAVSAAGSTTIYVLNAEGGDVVASFDTPGTASLYQLPDPVHAVALHRDANRVTVIHSGLSAVDHGDHADLVQGSPYVLATLNLGRQPTHFFARGDDIAVFNDQDGTVAWLDARLLGISLDYTEIVARNPDHGALAVLADHMVVGLLATGEVDVYDRGGESVAHFSGCPALHGQAATDSTVTFGCSDGVLIVRSVGGGVFSAHKLTNPAGSPEGARVSTLTYTPDSGVIVGNFGTGIAVIDTEARTFVTYTLPATQVAGRLYEDGELYVHLGSDGHLRSIDPLSGEVLADLELVDPIVEGAVRPALAVLGDVAFVTDPGHGAVREIDLDGFVETTHFHLPFTPAGIAIMAIPGAVSH